MTLKYNKNYVGLARDGVADNFDQMCPRQQHVIAEFRIPRSDELSSRLEEQGIEMLEYSTRWGRYRIRLTASDVATRRDLLLQLVQLSLTLVATEVPGRGVPARRPDPDR